MKKSIKRFLAGIITFCMLFSMIQITAFAGDDALTFSKTTVSKGETFTMTFTHSETVVASSIGLDIVFDNEAFEITKIDYTNYSTLQPDLAGCNRMGNVAISWTDPSFDANTTVTAGTVLLNVTFKVIDSASSGKKTFNVRDYAVTGKFNETTLMPADITPDAGTKTKTVTVSGNSSSGGSSSSGSSSSGRNDAPSKPEKEEVKEEVKENVNKPVSGWVKNGNSWYYYANGTAKKGWLKDGNAWYYLGADGAMKTGWIKDGSVWYFMKSSGAMATGWVKDGNSWYFMKSSGVMATGWVKDGNSWYFMNSSGTMKTGWLNDGGKWYYLNSSGAMVTNTVIDGCKINASGVWVK